MYNRRSKRPRFINSIGIACAKVMGPDAHRSPPADDEHATSTMVSISFWGTQLNLQTLVMGGLGVQSEDLPHPQAPKDKEGGLPIFCSPEGPVVFISKLLLDYLFPKYICGYCNLLFENLNLT